MKNIKLFVLIIVIFNSLALDAFAGFALDQGLGIKSMQAGGAYTAAPQGSEAVYWNSGRLGFMNDSQIYSAYSDQFGMGRILTILYSTKLAQDTGIGFGFFRDGIEDIDYTDGSGAPIDNGSISFTTDAFFLAIGQRLGSHGLGATLKMAQQNLGSIDKKRSYSIDLDYHLQLSDTLEFGLVAQDAIKRSTEKGTSLAYRGGLAYTIADLNVSYDLAYYNVFKQYASNIGAAYKLFKMLEIKGGYSGYDKNIYAGASLTYSGFSLDYVFSNQELAVLQKAGLGISF